MATEYAKEFLLRLESDEACKLEKLKEKFGFSYNKITIKGIEKMYATLFENENDERGEVNLTLTAHEADWLLEFLRDCAKQLRSEKKRPIVELRDIANRLMNLVVGGE